MNILVEKFKEHLDEKVLGKYTKYSENTLKNYMLHLKRFTKYLEEKNIDILEVNLTNAKEYNKDLEKNYKASTINTHISSLISFYDFVILDQEKNINNPFNKKMLIRASVLDEDKDKKEILTKEECRKILKATTTRVLADRDFEFLSARDRAMFSILMTNGCRFNELAKAQYSYVEKIEIGYAINIPRNMVKNDLYKRLILTGKTAQYFEEYLEVRKNLVEPDNKLLFFSNRGKLITTGNFNKRIAKFVDAANIDKHISVHCFRGSCTTIMKLNNVKDTIINLVLGWKDRTMLKAYSQNKLSEYDEMKAKAVSWL